MSHHYSPARLIWSCCLTLSILSFSPGFAAEELQVSEEAISKIQEALPDAAPASPAKDRHVLIYSRTLGFRHGSIPVGVKALQMLGEKTGAYTSVCTEDPTAFDDLTSFDAILLVNTTGDCLAPQKDDLSDEQKAALERRKENLRRFVVEGKGLVGSHAATDCFYSWKEFGDMMGGYFTGHPWTTEVPLKLDAPGHPLIAMFDPENTFVIKDEIYQFGPRGNQHQPYSRDRLRVLLSLDAAQFDVWIQNYGQGRVFYCSLGHFNEVYWDPTVLRHYLAGIQYAMGDLPADATPSGSVSMNSRTIELFNGRNLDGWKLRRDRGSQWVVGEVMIDSADPTNLMVQGSAGDLVNAQGRGVDLITVDEFGDCTLEIDLMVPRRSNSGIYLQGNYEIQVLDSYGKQQMSPGDLGGIYGAAAPATNAAKAPGEWQTFLIEFQAPRFEDGQKVKNAIFKKIVLNGEVIQENVEVAGPTGGNLGRGDVARGPLMLQGDHGPVAFRNIKITVPAQE
jgi:type 1 glutamine amidotransferase